MSNPRTVAVKALVKIEKDNAYSNITLNSIFKTVELKPVDKAFASALVYGVLDRRITLDWVLSQFMKTPIKKTAPFTLNVLRVALYQIMFMDKIPSSAAVNEAVKAVKASKEARNSGFVNAVLRTVLREDIALPATDSVKDLSIRYSCPSWIIESFLKDYGKENTLALLEESLKTPPVTLRVNTTKTTAETLEKELLESGFETESTHLLNSLVLKNGADITSLESFKKGEFYVQDAASQTAVKTLSPKPFERVLDICAAPGGKSFTMACLMENKGEIVACDLYEQRVGLIKEGAKRLSLDIIKPETQDATVYNADLGLFDCILCDVPCSGLGVLRRKPDIKYKPEEDFSQLEETQYRIFKNALRYLKKGGRILYSTCTLRRAENENLAKRIQEEYNDVVKVNEHTFMPHIDNTDGFYLALFVKKEDGSLD